MEVRCVMCTGRGHCDYTDWEMDEKGAFVAAADISDCPDFELDPDHISEVVATEILLMDPEMYAKAHVQFSLPDKLLVRIFLKKNVLDDKEEIQQMLEEVTENLEYLANGTIGIQDMLIQIDFAFESENNPKIPNALPTDITANQLEKVDDDWEDEEEDVFGNVDHRDDEWEDEEDPEHQGDSPIDWGEE